MISSHGIVGLVVTSTLLPRLSMCRPTADRPYKLVAAGCPFVGGLGHSRSPLVGGQAMADHPCSGPGRGQPPLHVDSMQIRMERMKEVKRPL
ncbi:hypothetical protein BHM03_00039555 [Ensete ventricosum]|nr:hypothetical protein BHM03_00039555 [Ensete ventricosum]